MATPCRMLRSSGAVYTIVWILFLIDVIRVGEGVEIYPWRKPISARDTDPIVTLPCNFTTSTHDSPRITWFRYRNGERIQIMKYQGNRLFSYGELLDRVARGDGGALVLIRPSVKDSGNYSCEVEVERERPSWTKADVYLDVKSQDIIIRQKSNSKTAEESDSSVTLPCDFTTDGPGIPEIMWRLERNGVTLAIVTFGERGDLRSVDDQFLGRVARGDKGDLVLISPREGDSGTYRCAVKAGMTSNWVTIDLNLSVKGDRKVLTDLFVLISVLWVLPVLCGFLLEGMVYDHLQGLCRGTKSPRRSGDGKGVNRGWRYIPTVLALCLMFSGTVCSAKALSSRDHTDYNKYKVVGYATGIAGVIMICGVYIIRVALIKLENKRTSNRKYGFNPVKRRAIFKSAKSKNTNEIRYENKAGTSAENRQDETPLVKPTQETISKGYELKPNKGDEKETINGMVFVSKNELYVTTPSGLYHFDSSEKTFSKIPSPELSVKMVSKFKRGVLLLTGLAGPNNTYKSEIFPVILDKTTENASTCSVDMNINSFFSETDHNYIYLTLKDSQEIYRAFEYNQLKNNNLKPINTSVLKHPENVCKNSQGKIIVSDSTRSDVFVFDKDTGLVTSMKISVPKELTDELRGCNRLAIGPDDRIYVTGPNTKNVFVFSEDFRYERVIHTGTKSSDSVSCLMIHDNSLHVARKNCITVYPLKN